MVEDVVGSILDREASVLVGNTKSVQRYSHQDGGVTTSLDDRHILSLSCKTLLFGNSCQSSQEVQSLRPMKHTQRQAPSYNF